MKIVNSFRNEFAFLSNFHRNPDGWTTEHFYQAKKAMTTEDYCKIKNKQLTPGQVKRLGYSIKMSPTFEENKVKIMYCCLIQKFSQCELADKLIELKDLQIIEGNYWHDNYWGNCYCEKCKNVKGKNVLGQLLMIIRDILLKDNYKNLKDYSFEKIKDKLKC